jgi:ferritin
MAIGQIIEEAINKQINAELYSEYLYLAMSAFFESINFSGMAHWMRVQALEEREHAMKLYDHLVERGGRVRLFQINQPPLEWSSPLEVFENAYKHEQEITNMINNLVELATNEKDHAAKVMLQWFVTEQVEEESSADTIVQKLRMVGESKGSLLMLDKQLGKRK